MYFSVNIIVEELLVCIVILYVISRKRYDSQEFFHIETIVCEFCMSSSVRMCAL